MTYVRMYETEQKARDVVKKLKDDGFPENAILVVTPGANSEAVLGFTIGKDAKDYAQSLARGRTLVLVRAAFGFGKAAVDILDSCGPVDTDLLQPPKTCTSWEETAAPFSSAWQWPVLKYNEPAPFSDWLGIPLLSECCKSQSDLISRMSAMTSELSFGIRMLSDKATPLSSLLKLTVLDNNAGRMSASFGLPLLSESKAPLSGIFGLPLLTSR